MRLAIVALVAGLWIHHARADQPNIVFILADDMGWGDPAVQGGKIPTPHIDRIATEGLRFSDAHTTSSVCTPTRYSILTGRYNWRSELQEGVLWGSSPPLIEAERATVARFLQRRGYATSVIGKWHLGLGWSMQEDRAEDPTTNLPADKVPADKVPAAEQRGPEWNIDYSRPVAGGPLALGFDEDFLYPASLDMPPYVYLRNDRAVAVPTVSKAFKVPHRPGPATVDFEADQCLDDFAREAVAFIDRSAAADKPFFLYLPLTSPHTPIVPTPPWQGKSGLGEYGDFVMQTDWVVGRVLAALDDADLADNTLVIFTSDNGCSPMADIPSLVRQGHKPVGDWRGHKADIFEGGHRVPLLIRWPRGGVAAGGTCDQTVCLVDFYATVADVAGATPELAPDEAEDSFSWLPLLADPQHREVIRPFTIHHSINGSFAVRRGPWKLCLCPDSGGWSDPKPSPAGQGGDLPPVQLYHLDRDPRETTNVAHQHPELVAELKRLVDQARRDGRTRIAQSQD